ncbi:hypothetical protein J2Z21_009370 [Streptomyces griseochromogenes]|uniref:Uncharacterized protein n=1 Tax=Streptomyces griseochromogenes TaxID=68214 RepID=A0ABS4M9J8_9ACTN|nr:hypothetical protein [Streptomyces griseochromogenes]
MIWNGQGRRECWDVIGRLSMWPESSMDVAVVGRLRVCPACMSVYKGVARLDG